MSKYVGKKFGNLEVLSSRAQRTDGGNYKQVLLVRCSCGREIEVSPRVLNASKPMCADCRAKEKSAAAAKGYKHPLYGLWWGMVCRCYDASSPSFMYYGGRGVSVHPRWLGNITPGELARIDGFHAFCEDLGERPEGTTLDRINNDGNYEPGNCRWATLETQNNNRRNNVRITVGGETKTLAQWQRALCAPSLSTAAWAYGVALQDAVYAAVKAGPQTRWDWAAVFSGVATKKPTRSSFISKRRPFSDEQRAEINSWLETIELC